MTIADLGEKCKGAFRSVPRDLLIFGVIILASSASFGLGFLAGRDAGQGSDALRTVSLAASSTGAIVASKGGTKYYLPWCPGVDRIADANKVWFATPTDAAKAGYAPATNCKGL